jgi:hypothetical protein
MVNFIGGGNQSTQRQGLQEKFCKVEQDCFGALGTGLLQVTDLYHIMLYQVHENLDHNPQR